MGGSVPSSSEDPSISELREKHQLELENMTLTMQPLKTFKFFIFASASYMKRFVLYSLTKGVWFTILTTLFVAGGLFLVATGGPHEKGVVTYTVLDDLSVMPMSTISSITMLNKFDDKDIASLVEKHVVK